MVAVLDSRGGAYLKEGLDLAIVDKPEKTRKARFVGTPGTEALTPRSILELPVDILAACCTSEKSDHWREPPIASRRSLSRRQRTARRRRPPTEFFGRRESSSCPDILGKRRRCCCELLRVGAEPFQPAVGRRRGSHQTSAQDEAGHAKRWLRNSPRLRDELPERSACPGPRLIGMPRPSMIQICAPRLRLLLLGGCCGLRSDRGHLAVTPLERSGRRVSITSVPP